MNLLSNCYLPFGFGIGKTLFVPLGLDVSGLDVSVSLIYFNNNVIFQPIEIEPIN